MTATLVMIMGAFNELLRSARIYHSTLDGHDASCVPRIGKDNNQLARCRDRFACDTEIASLAMTAA